MKVFDFRNTDQDGQTELLDDVKYLQWRIWQAQELQERMTQFLSKRHSKNIWSWLRSTLSVGQRLEASGRLIADLGIFGEELQQSVHGVALLRSTQTPLKELLLQETPDILVITTDKPGTVCGAYQQTPPSGTALRSPKLSDCEPGCKKCSEP